MGRERSTHDRQGRDLLAGLQSPNAGSAWQYFLDRYSPTIMRVASQFGDHPVWRNDCYVFVCERLCDDNFRRLLQFDPDGAAGFRSWLKVVITNLCIDYTRQAKGRDRPYRNIQDLSPLEQVVFKYRFQRKLNLSACLEELKPRFPGLTVEQLRLVVQRINETLTPRQQWLLSTSNPRLLSFEDFAENAAGSLPSGVGPNPEQFALETEQRDRLDQAMSQLQPRQRLLLKLRYQQDLTLREVARLTRLGDPFRASREIRKALAELAALLEN